MCFRCPSAVGVFVCVHIITSLNSWSIGIVAMQMEALEAVHRESRRLPPIQKVSVTLQQLRLNIQFIYTCMVEWNIFQMQPFQKIFSMGIMGNLLQHSSSWLERKIQNWIICNHTSVYYFYALCPTTIVLMSIFITFSFTCSFLSGSCSWRLAMLSSHHSTFRFYHLVVWTLLCCMSASSW